MANPARVPDPRLDPLTPTSTTGIDPLVSDSRLTPANSDPRLNDPRIVNRVETRSGGTGLLIAAVVVVLALIAYFAFAPGSNAPGPSDPATTGEAASPPAGDAAAPAAPDAMAPAAPADSAAPAPADATAPAPDASAPAAPADGAAPAPNATAPAAPAQ